MKNRVLPVSLLIAFSLMGCSKVETEVSTRTSFETIPFSEVTEETTAPAAPEEFSPYLDEGTELEPIPVDFEITDNHVTGEYTDELGRIVFDFDYMDYGVNSVSVYSTPYNRGFMVHALRYSDIEGDWHSVDRGLRPNDFDLVQACRNITIQDIENFPEIASVYEAYSERNTWSPSVISMNDGTYSLMILREELDGLPIGTPDDFFHPYHSAYYGNFRCEICLKDRSLVVSVNDEEGITVDPLTYSLGEPELIEGPYDAISFEELLDYIVPGIRSRLGDAGDIEVVGAELHYIVLTEYNETNDGVIYTYNLRTAPVWSIYFIRQGLRFDLHFNAISGEMIESNFDECTHATT